MKKIIISLAMCPILFASCANGFLRGGDPGAIQIGSIIGYTVGGVIGHNMDHWNGYAVGSMVGAITGAAVANEATKPHINQYAANNGNSNQYVENNSNNNLQPYSNSNQQDTNSNQPYSNSNQQDTNSNQQYDNSNQPYTNSNQNSETNINSNQNVNSNNNGVASDYRDRISETSLDVRNIRFVDQNRNKVINKGETCHLIFDVYNSGNITAYAVRPVVTVVDGEKNLDITTPPLVKMLMPGEVVMYDVVVKAHSDISNTFSTFRIEIHDRDGYSNNYRQFSIDASNEN